jgi:hypothetical protein
METYPYQHILKHLQSNLNEFGIDYLISQEGLESFYIDYKESRFDGLKLHKDDRKNLAKAISGFANTSGGLIIWGIEEDRKNKKFNQKPIQNPQKLANLFNESVSSLTQPAQTNVHSFPIILEDGYGYVVTEIPKYYMSPVQVIANIDKLQFRYYIRSGSSFVAANHDLLTGLYNRHRSSRIISFWSKSEEHQENDQLITYRVGFCLQNKGIGVLRDVWINFSSSGVELQIHSASSAQIYDTYNVFGQAINMITKEGYKFAPQAIMNPFILQIIIKKQDIKNGGWIYFSYGADQVSPVEKKVEFTKDQLVSFLSQVDVGTDSFLKFIGLASD